MIANLPVLCLDCLLNDGTRRDFYVTSVNEEWFKLLFRSNFVISMTGTTHKFIKNRLTGEENSNFSIIENYEERAILAMLNENVHKNYPDFYR